MKGFLKLLAAALLVMLLFSSCAVPTGLNRPSEEVEHALIALRQSYRSAALVVRGVCMQTHTDANGAVCDDVEISEVLAGSAKAGSLLHCVSGGLKEGGSYLLFLGAPEDVHYAEDEASFQVISSDTLEVSGGEAMLKTAGVALSEVRKELKRLDAVIGAPATSYYHTALSALAEAADEIFIGRVKKQPALSSTPFRSQEGGGTVEQELPASLVRVTAFGAVKGALKYGDEIDLVYAPAMGADVVDAATLTATSYKENAVPVLKEGQIYIFFLMHGPDPKQSYYFPVNPYQGYVPVANDSLNVSFVNTALIGYASLTPLVQDIRSLLGI